MVNKNCAQNPVKLFLSLCVFIRKLSGLTVYANAYANADANAMHVIVIVIVIVKAIVIAKAIVILLCYSQRQDNITSHCYRNDDVYIYRSVAKNKALDKKR